MPEQAILHVDMDAFYASVEVLDDPSLQGKAVIVGGSPEGRGVVSAASYEARAFGVHSAMPTGQAYRLCPQGVFLHPRMERYVEISRRIQAIFTAFTPLVEPISVDEAFLDVTGCRRLFGSAVQIGHTIKRRIAAEIGLTASVGVAPNKFLAKLGSDLEKPDGFVVIEREGAVALLAGLPVGRLWGVGRVTERELNRQGIRTVADLLAAPRQALLDRYGDHAAHLLELAVGHDERPVVPDHEARSIGNEITFAEDIGDSDELQVILDQLAAKVARRLRQAERLARTVSIKARYPDFTTHTRATTLAETTDSSAEIRAAARRLFTRQLGRRGRKLRLLGVTVAKLCQPVITQPELFADPVSERERTLDRVLDDVHGKYGDLLQRGAGRRRHRR